MDQKTELVKLLGQMQEWGADANEVWPDTDFPIVTNEEVADHLIANGVVVLSHVMLLEVEEDFGPFQLPKVVLFNENKVSQEEALRLVQAGEYSDNVLCIPKRQWTSLFRDGKEG